MFGPTHPQLLTSKKRNKGWQPLEKEDIKKMIRYLLFVLLLGPGVGPLRLPDSLKPPTASKPTTEKADSNSIITLTFTAWAAIYSEIKDLQVSNIFFL